MADDDLKQMLGTLITIFEQTIPTLATKEDLRQVEGRLDAKIDTTRTELEAMIDSKIDGVRTELGAKIDTVRTDLGARIDALVRPAAE